MPSNNRNLKQHICTSCGAPLSDSGKKGKYICQYCGATYYDDNYAGEPSGPYEDIPENPPGNEGDFQPQPPATSPYPQRKNTKMLKATGIVLGVMLMACSLLFVVFGSSSRTGNNAVATKPEIKKPEMLSELPKTAQAGASIAYNGWEIIVDPDIAVDNNALSFQFSVHNWMDKDQVLSYQPNSITAYDDLGNSYPLRLDQCNPDLPYMNKQVLFSANTELVFESRSYWCDEGKYIPRFFGVIPQNANAIYLNFHEFGPFTDITFIIKL